MKKKLKKTLNPYSKRVKIALIQEVKTNTQRNAFLHGVYLRKRSNSWLTSRINGYLVLAVYIEAGVNWACVECARAARRLWPRLRVLALRLTPMHIKRSSYLRWCRFQNAPQCRVPSTMSSRQSSLYPWQIQQTGLDLPSTQQCK